MLSCKHTPKEKVEITNNFSDREELGSLFEPPNAKNDKDAITIHHQFLRKHRVPSSSVLTAKQSPLTVTIFPELHVPIKF